MKTPIRWVKGLRGTLRSQIVCVSLVVGGKVCDVTAPEARRDEYANLIAASPDLLEACETLADASQSDLNTETELWDKLDAAIAKAHGEIK